MAAFSSAPQQQDPVTDEIDDEDEDETEEDGTEEDLRLPATALLFRAPEPTRSRRRVQAAAGAPVAPQPANEDTEEEDDTDDTAPKQRNGRGQRRRSGQGSGGGRGRSGQDSADHTADTAGTDASDAEAGSDTDTDEATADNGASDSSESSGRRRRRRGGRGRRNRGPQHDEDSDDSDSSADDSDESSNDSAPASSGRATSSNAADDARDDQDDSDDDSSDGSSRRRRRRRRSSGSRSTEDSGTADSREGRAARDEITPLHGSTRLEAKRQRRRDGRDAGRRRTTISESEFLARREAVDREMIVREHDGRIQIAVLEDKVLVEHYVAQETQSSMVGNVYLGRVQNVLPSMEAAFVDLGRGRNAVLYAGEVNWDAVGMGGKPRRIEQALSSGDPVMVQVTKDPIGHKGARLTSQVTLAGRYLVLVPSGAMTGISRKLPENERARLKKLLKEIVPAGSGVIVRTAAEGASEEQLRADVERLTRKWESIQAKAKSAKAAPVLLQGEPELAVRVVRDVFNEDFRALTVAGDGAWQTISEYVGELSPDLAHRMHHWTDSKDVFAAYRIDEQLAKGMDRKVYLPSGGSLVIDRTEAMTVVDVNTGKFVGSGGTLEETVTKNNLEAAEEVVRQLRLRDIGGIIVIDFIDMVLESNRDLVMRRLIECLGRDRTRHQVAEVTSLGLIQMTRKRVGQGLVEAFSETCEHCAGRGFIVHDQPIEKSSGNGDNGGSRRRGARKPGSDTASSSGRPVVQEKPVELPPVSDDPESIKARDAVKATLATIAAAAAQAHDEIPQDEADAASAGSDGATAAAVSDATSATGAAPATSAGDAAPATRAADVAPAKPAADGAPAGEDAPAPARGRRRVTSGGGTKAATQAEAPIELPTASTTQATDPAAATTTASLEALEAALPTRAPARGGRRAVRSETTAPAAAGEAAPATADATADAAPATAGMATGDAARADAEATKAPAKADAPKADAVAGEAEPATTSTGRRRSRRVTSGGPVTA
ncbi:Rne/Rng family ribonuclease [Georgenia sunbinii]|uniref:Rne/Rng family ribonuclease n=1 Tax=Georgenia sunbinii TaxID=3117728 RepID=UPI003D9C1098